MKQCPVSDDKGNIPNCATCIHSHEVQLPDHHPHAPAFPRRDVMYMATVCPDEMGEYYNINQVVPKKVDDRCSKWEK